MSANSNAKDFEALQSQKELSNEELNEVVGGSGELTHYVVVESRLLAVTSRCEMVRDKERLILCFRMGAEHCQYYQWNGSGSDEKKCTCCVNLNELTVQFIKNL